jgi:membrane-associated phospholipid phosphatase
MAGPSPGADRYLACGTALIAVTALAAALLAGCSALVFPPEDAIEPALITLGLGIGACIYRRRKVQQFELALTALALVTTFTAFYSVLMYAIGALSGPMTDDLLQRADAACGVYLPDIVAWSQRNPTLERALRWAYDSVMFQTAAVIVLLSFTSDERSLKGFVIQFMIAALITMAAFAFFPASGPCACFDYQIQPGLDGYVSHMHELKSGARTIVTWRNAEGLVTFPSFHTTWAILLAWALRRKRVLNVLAWILNGAVAASTLTLGLHYFVDVPGGLAIAIAAIALEARIWKWCQAAAPEVVENPGIVASQPAFLDLSPDQLAIVRNGEDSAPGVSSTTDAPALQEV